jgi:hypothetical protein
MRARPLIAALASALATAAVAGPPFNTDDPVPVELHHGEIYLASGFARDGGGTMGTLPHVDANYGVTNDIHLHVLLPWAFNSPSGGRTTRGFGDAEIGAKIRFYKDKKEAFQIATFPAIDFPTGSVRRGLGSGETRYFLPIWIQKEIGEWTFYGGAGFWRNPGAGNRDFWFSGIVAQRQMSKNFALGAELYNTTSSVVDDPNHTGFNVGGTYDLDEGHHLLLALGKDLHGGTSMTGFVGFQWTFGVGEAKGK